MKTKICMSFAAVLLLVSIAGVSFAAPYTGADIEQRGMDFTNSSGFTYDPIKSGDLQWHQNGDAVFTAWAGRWIDYTAYLTAGTWNIGVNVINYGNLGDGWYTAFEVRNSQTNQVMTIPASSTEVNHGFVTVDIYENANLTVRYTWLNDQYSQPLGLDANIQINSVFFDDLGTTSSVPEPATMFLFGTGLIGIAGTRIRRRVKA